MNVRVGKLEIKKDWMSHPPRVVVHQEVEVLNRSRRDYSVVSAHLSLRQPQAHEIDHGFHEERLRFRSTGLDPPIPLHGPEIIKFLMELRLAEDDLWLGKDVAGTVVITDIHQKSYKVNINFTIPELGERPAS